MDNQQHIQALRLHLLEMSKLSHRAVDYAIKGYRLGSPEFCRFVRRGDSQLGELRRKITQLCHKLMTEEITPDSNPSINQPPLAFEARFPHSALRICTALHETCTAASEIAHHTMMLLEDLRVSGSAALDKICHLVNRLMCLCILALFKKEKQHAETILQSQDVPRLFEKAFHDLRKNVSGQVAIPLALELAITNSLRHIARQTHEIAEAVLYWLEGNTFALKSGASAYP